MKRSLISTLLFFTLFLFIFLPHTVAEDATRLGLPEEAVARIGKGKIDEITYSPDGSLLAVASSIGTWLYDTQTGEALDLLTGHTHLDGVMSVAFSPDGQTLASGSSRGTIRLWDVQTRTLKQTIHWSGNIPSVAFSPDGQTLAGANVGYIGLWDVATGRHLQSIGTEEKCNVLDVAFSRDGQTLVSGNWDSTVRWWDVATGTQTHKLTEHTGLVYSIAFSPDGKTVASQSRDGTVRLWDADSGGHINTLTWESVGSSGRMSIVFSPDGQTLASGGKTGYGEGVIYLWDADTGARINTLTGHTDLVITVAFSPDGNTLASAGWDGTIRLWDVDTGGPINTLTGHRNAFSSVGCVALSPNGNTLATSWDNTILLWDADTGARINTLTGHTADVSSIAFSPDGNTLASGSRDDTVRLWDAQTGVLQHTLTEEGLAYAAIYVAFSPDGQTLAGGGGENYFDASIGTSVNSGTIHLWDVDTGIRINTFTGQHTNAVTSVAFSPDGQTLVSGGTNYHFDEATDTFISNGIIHLWDVDIGTPIHTLTGHTDIVSVAFSPDGQTLVSGSLDNTLRLWDVATGQHLQTLTGHWQEFTTVVFSPDGQTLVSGSWDGTIRLWDVATGEPFQTLGGHTHITNSIAFSLDGQIMASGSYDGTALLWEVMPASPEPERLTADVNGDGEVNIQDLVAVAAALGQTGENAADVNGDGEVNIQDLVAVAAALGQVAAAPAAIRQQVPAHLTTADVQHWITQAQHARLTDPYSQAGIRFLQYLLAALIPKETALFANYPNPFNPETWIPYQLATPADVSISIYAVDGTLVRALDLGHQPVGIYESKSRAAYWDGKNEIGESVASGVYFYTLTAGDFIATRKMLIRK